MRSSPPAPATGRPFYTPDSVLERGFRRNAMTKVKADSIGRGSYFVARKGD